MLQPASGVQPVQGAPVDQTTPSAQPRVPTPPAADISPIASLEATPAVEVDFESFLALINNDDIPPALRIRLVNELGLNAEVKELVEIHTRAPMKDDVLRLALSPFFKQKIVATEAQIEEAIREEIAKEREGDDITDPTIPSEASEATELKTAVMNIIRKVKPVLSQANRDVRTALSPAVRETREALRPAAREVRELSRSLFGKKSRGKFRKGLKKTFH